MHTARVSSEADDWADNTDSEELAEGGVVWLAWLTVHVFLMNCQCAR